MKAVTEFVKKTWKNIRYFFIVVVSHSSSYSPLLLPWLPGKRTAGTNMAELYRRTAAITWRNRTNLEKVAVCVSIPLWPLLAALYTISKVRRLGPLARMSFGVSIPSQLFRCWRLCTVHGIATEEFYKFRSFTLGDFSAAPFYIQHSTILAVHRDLNKGLNVNTLVDKFLFYEFCTEHGLSSAPVYALFKDGKLAWRNTDAASLPHVDLFLKAHNYYRGLDSELWIAQKNGDGWERDGEQLNEEELLNHFSTLSKGGRNFLLQPRVVNNAQIQSFSPNALATIRVVTYKFPHEKPQALSGQLAIPVGDHHTDHDAMGAGVDLESGELTPAIFVFLDPEIMSQVDETKVLAFWDYHPTTGTRITGTQLEGWSEMVELCRKAHSHLDYLAFVGWDVTMTPDGPMLIEGNSEWGHTSSQVAQGIPLGRTPFVDCYLAHKAEKEGKTTKQE